MTGSQAALPAQKKLRRERLARFLEAFDRTSSNAWLGAVLVVAVLQRVGLWLFYQPLAYSDTHSYKRMATAILEGWDAYDGTRTPGYSLLLAALGNQDRLIFFVQMAMGLAVTLLVFGMAWLISGRAWFSGLAALAHTLNPGQVLFEPNLLSETSTTFWVVLAVGGAFWWLRRPERRTAFLALGLALAVSMAWLARPLFIFLPVWFILGLGAAAWLDGTLRGRRSVYLVQAAAFLLPAALVIGGWVSFIHLRFGDWSLTTMTGYHLVQHTGGFFEYVPDEHAELRDTYLRYRDEQVREHGSQTNTIWRAIPEMQKVSGASFYELSRVLARISVQLIREHPELYLRNVLKGWWYFWRGPVYWSPQAFEPAWLGAALSPLVLVGRLAVFGANLLFLGTTILAVFVPRLRRDWRIPGALWFTAGLIWAASGVQTLVDHGDNPRFLIPLQSLVMLWVLWIAYQQAARMLEVKGRTTT